MKHGIKRRTVLKALGIGTLAASLRDSAVAAEAPASATQETESVGAKTALKTPLLAEQLAQHIVEFRADAIPQPALDEAARRILDCLGCAYGALDEVAAKATLRAVESAGGTPQCSVIGQSWRTSVGNAALANGTLVRCLDLNDVGIGVRYTGHPSDNIPVALALGEQLNSSGRDVLAAIVLGYEIYGRIPSPGLRTLIDWHPVGNSAAVTAVMCGYLMKLDPKTLVSAIGLSVAQCSTMGTSSNGVGGKATANAMVTYGAIMQTLMAADGLTGPINALEDYSRLVCGGADFGALAQPIGPNFLIMDAGMKAYPAVGTAQTAVEAALRVRSSTPDPLKDIASINVQMADVPAIREQVDRAPELPHSREAADHSFPFLIAVSIMDGRFTLQQFANNRWLDPKIVTLMKRTTFGVDPKLNQYASAGNYPCAITITKQDGKQVSAAVPYHSGDLKNPMTWANVENKFNDWAEPHVPAPRRKAIVKATTTLSQAHSVRELMSLVSKA